MRFGITRRGFAAVAVSAAALVRSAAADAQPSPAPSPAERVRLREMSATVPFHFDRAAFEAVLARPYPHRQLVVGTSYQRATVSIAHLRNSLAAYADPNGFAAGPNGLHCAGVFYGGYAPAMMLDDAMYAKYHVGALCDEEMRPNDASARAVWTAMQTNPMGEYLRSLTDQGVSFFVCNNALTSLAVELARRQAGGAAALTRESVVAVHGELAAHFVPGTMLVPAGVAAVNAAQEARFTFLPE